MDDVSRRFLYTTLMSRTHVKYAVEKMISRMFWMKHLASQRIILVTLSQLI